MSFFAGKTIFVTGHTGFKGSWLSVWLHHLGATVHGFSLKPSYTPSLFSALPQSIFLTSTIADIRDPHILRNTLNSVQPDLIFHLAAQPIVATSIEDPLETFNVNILGMANLLEAVRCLTNKVSVVLVTSDKVYHNNEWSWGYRETDILGGHDPYSASKSCAEIVAQSYFKTFFANSCNHSNFAIGRAGNVIGGGDWSPNRIVPDLVRAWASKVPLLLRSPHSTRPWQHVLEPLSGYLRLAQILLSEPSSINTEAFNFGPTPATVKSVYDLSTALAQVLSADVLISEENPLSSKESSLLQLCCDKANNILGWSPTLSFDQTVSFTADWYKRFYDGHSAYDLILEQIDLFNQIRSN